MFTLKKQAEEAMEDGGNEEEDDFQTDEDEDDVEEMEVEKQVQQKRKKVWWSLTNHFVCVCGSDFFFYNLIMSFSLPNNNPVIFVYSRSKAVVFKRNSEITTGNQDVTRKTWKREMENKNSEPYL